MKDLVNKILFISLSNIGDAVMTTPVLQALHELYPGAVVDIVGDQRSSVIFKHCPYRGKIFHKQKNSFLRGGPALIMDLWAQSYDLIVDLRTDGLAYLLPAGNRLTKLNRIKTGAHSVQQHLGIISKIYHSDPPQCHVWISSTEKNLLKSFLAIITEKKCWVWERGRIPRKKYGLKRTIYHWWKKRESFLMLSFFWGIAGTRNIQTISLRGLMSHVLTCVE